MRVRVGGMKLLVSGCTVTMSRMLGERPDRLGVLLEPAGGNRVWFPEGTTWACDNGCFGGLDAPKFMRMLAKVKNAHSLPSWVTAPDAVGDMGETWRRFYVWQPLLAEIGLPVALVLQDGLETFKYRAPLASSWDKIAAVFVGGSTAFKLSDFALSVTKEARGQGKLVHFGRVNSFRRILWIARACRDGRGWCDTIDGGSGTRWGETNLPKLIRYIDKSLACKQLVMFGGNA